MSENRKKYYYEVPGSRAAYTSIPIGQPNLQRMLAGKPCWTLPYGAKVEAKKKLILYAPEIAMWSQNRCIVAAECLEALEKEGFELYVYNKEGVLTALDINALQAPAQLFGPVPQDPVAKKKLEEKIIHEALEEGHLSRDQVFLLNQAELMLLSNGDDIDVSAWDAQELTKLDLSRSNLSRHLLSHLLKKNEDSLTSLNLSGCLNLGSDCLACDWPSSLANLTQLILSGSSAPRIFIAVPVNIKREPTLRDGELSEGRIAVLPSDRKHELASCAALKPGSGSHILGNRCKRDLFQKEEAVFPAHLVNLLVRLSVQLEMLDLSYSQQPNLNCLWFIQQPEQLKVLRLAGHIFKDHDPALLIDIFKKTKLKVLDLKGCQGLSEKMFDKIDGCFEALEELNVDGSGIHGASIEKILEQAKYLKRYSGLLSDETMKHLNPDLLEELNCSDNWDASSDEWKKFFARVRQLKNLSLSECQFANEAMEVLQPVALQKLDLDKAPIKTDSLVAFLAQAQNLVSLTVSYCQLVDRAPDDLNLVLPELKELVLEGNDNELRILLPMFRQTSHLEKLTLSCLSGSSNALFSDLNFSSLKELTISSESEINASLFEQHLQEAKSLEKLTLANTHFSGDITQALDLYSLKELDVTDSTISYASIKNMIAHSKHKVRVIGYRRKAGELSFHANTSNTTDRLKKSPKKIPAIARRQKVNLLQPEAVKTPDPDEDVSHLDTTPTALAAAATPEEVKTTAPNVGDPPTAPAASPANSAATAVSVPEEIKTPDPSKGASPAVSAAPMSPDAQEKVDADTTHDPDKSFELKKVFYSQDGRDPDIGLYRLSTFNQLDVNPNVCSMAHAFTLKNKGDLKLVSPPGRFEEIKEDTYGHLPHLPSENHHYYGKTSLSLTKKWQALPSLSAQEILTKYHLSHSSDSSAKVEIKYSKRDNLYYIRSNKTVSLDMDFILQVPSPAEQKLPAKKLPDDILKKLEACGTEGIAKEKLKEAQTGKAYLEALNAATEKEEAEPLGACRHRTAVFKAWMEKKHPKIPVRVVNNTSHSFIEMDLNGRGDWRIYDLGGYPAKENINEPHRPIKKSATKKVVPYSQPIPKSDKAYILSLFSGCHKKQLILLEDKQSIQALGIGLERYCLSTSRPCFYVRSPTDLVCSSPFVERDTENNGTLKPGPGGRLHRFLVEHKDRAPLIVVDYSGFAPHEIIQFNTLFDPTRTADGTALPKQAVVIGLMDHTSNHAYTGDDFYSRLDTYPLSCPLPKEAFAQPIDLPTQEAKEEKTIWMFGGHNWEEQLLGRWEFSQTAGAQFQFIEGELIKALRAWAEKNEDLESKDEEEPEPLHIHLNNAPWDNEDFVAFLQGILQHGLIKTGEGDYRLPKGLKLEITQSQRYSWEAYVQQIDSDVADGLENALVLNPTLLPRFLSQHRCDNATGTLQSMPGLLEQHKGETLSLYVSAPLSQHQWAQLLHLCQKHRVKINPICAPGVTLPTDLNISAPVLESQIYQSDLKEEEEEHLSPPPYWRGLRGGKVKNQLNNTLSLPSPKGRGVKNNHFVATAPWSSDECKSDFVVCSTDTVVTGAQIQADCYIDVSELDPGVLLERIKPLFDQEAATLKFEAQRGALLQLLNEGKTVVLTGTLQPLMVDALNELILKRQQTPATGKLIILSQQADLFPVLPTFEHPVTLAEKKALLEESHLHLRLVEPLSAIFFEEDYEQYSLSQLRAMLVAYAVHGDKMRAWEGMFSLPPTPPITDEDLTRLDEAYSAAFIKNRMNVVNAFLERAPFVFLAGKTAAGKTTFVEKQWKKENPRLYVGMDAFEAWANNDSEEEGYTTLLLDEANLSGKQWSQLQGLFCDPSGVMVDNHYRPFRRNHKRRVIFTGNALSDGGERQLPALFEWHGNSVIFEPMPPAFIFHEILKPVLAELQLHEIDSQTLAKSSFLKVAQFLTNCSTGKVLISPRELATMALYTVSYCSTHPNENPFAVAKYYAWHVAKNLVPKANQASFKKQWDPEPTLDRTSAKLPQRFTVNASNRPALDALNDALDLHALRQTAPEGSRLKSGGLGGLILEGEPEAGKSTLVREVLLARGFIKGVLREPDIDQVPSDQPVFYELPAGMPLAEKQKWLPKLFAKKNAVILADEINSSAQMEELYNQLLMSDGALLIGTQNPATQEGRLRETNALERRLRKVVIPSYSREERIDILRNLRLNRTPNIALPEEKCVALVDWYLQMRQEAEEQNALKPGSAPLIYFRQIIKSAKEKLKEIKINEKIDTNNPNWFEEAIQRRGVPDLNHKDCITLDLSNQNLANGAQAISDALKVNKIITELNLRDTGMSAEGVIVIAEALKANTSLKELYFRSNNIGIKGVEAIADVLKVNTSLTGLSLVSSRIGDREAEALADALKTNTSLTDLWFGYNEMGDREAEVLAEALKANTSLTNLYLRDNEIGVKGAKAIADALKVNTRLNTLDFTSNQINEAGAKAIAEALKVNTSLASLNLTDNRIGDEGAKAIADALKINTSLTRIDLDFNQIGAEGGKAILDALEINKSLTYIGLSQNYDLPDEIKKAIEEKLDRNKKLAEAVAAAKGNNSSWSPRFLFFVKKPPVKTEHSVEPEHLQQTTGGPNRKAS